MADDTSLYAQMQYQRGTGGSYVEKPAETLASIWLASLLVKRLIPNAEDVSSYNLHGHEPSALIT